MSAPVSIKTVIDSMAVTRYGFDAKVAELYREDPFCRVCGKLIERFEDGCYASERRGSVHDFEEFVIHDKGCKEELLMSQLQRSVVPTSAELRVSKE